MKASTWYKGPLTKGRIASLRRKLALARGMLSEIADARADSGVRVVYRDPEAPVIPSSIEIQCMLKRTADP